MKICWHAQIILQWPLNFFQHCILYTCSKNTPGVFSSLRGVSHILKMGNVCISWMIPDTFGQALEHEDKSVGICVVLKNGSFCAIFQQLSRGAW